MVNDIVAAVPQGKRWDVAATAGIDDLYEKFKSGVFDYHHDVLKAVRPDDIASVQWLFKQTAERYGNESAYGLVARYYEECLKRNPISWKTLGPYVDLEHKLKQAAKSELFEALHIFIEQRINAFVSSDLDSCPRAFKAVCDNVETKGSWVSKFWHHFSTGGIPRVWMKGVREVDKIILPSGAAGIREEYKIGALSTQSKPGALPGFSLEDIFVDGERAALLITGDPKRGARVGMSISMGDGGATAEAIEREFGSSLQYQGPGSFQHGEKLAMELMIAKGKVVLDKAPDARRNDAYILTFPDGRLVIGDKRKLRLSEITRDPRDDWVVLNLTGNGNITDVLRFKHEMKRAMASEAPATLFIRDGTVEWARENGKDERRFLVEFGDGTLGIMSTYTISEIEGVTDGKGIPMGINDMLVLLIRIGEKRGGVKSAAYLDTGHYDYASYYSYRGAQRRRVVIGLPDRTTQTCRIYFYREH